MFSPFVAVLGRMYKVNSKQASKRAVRLPANQTQAAGAGNPRRSCPSEHHLCGDQKLESELVRDIVCALQYPAALI